MVVRTDSGSVHMAAYPCNPRILFPSAIGRRMAASSSKGTGPIMFYASAAAINLRPCRHHALNLNPRSADRPGKRDDVIGR